MMNDFTLHTATKHVFALMLTFLVALSAFGQSTTTFWSSDGEDLTGWSNDGNRNWVVTGGGIAGNCFKTNAQFDNYENRRSYVLTSPEIDLSDFGSPKLEFYLQLTIEAYWDGGFLEVYDGTAWVQATDEIMTLPYDGTLSSSYQNPFGGTRAWSENINYTQVTVNLEAYTNVSNFKFRFSFGADNSNNDRGMYLDDLSIYGYAKTQIHNYGGSSQIVFNNSYLYTTAPVFRVSSLVGDPFNRFRVEINTAGDFSETIYYQEFTGTYNSGDEYNLTCNSLTPTSFSFSNNTTYYVRAKASADNGATWSDWSNQISFTYKSSTTSLPQWHQTAAYQFEQNTTNNTIINDEGSMDNKSFVIKTYSISESGDDAIAYNWNGGSDTYDENNSEYWTGALLQSGAYWNFWNGFRYQNVDLPANATIEEARLFLKAYRSDPHYGTTAEMALQIYADDRASSNQFTGGNSPHDRSAIDGLYVDWDVSSDEVWFDDYTYQTSDIKSLIQALVDQGGWSSGNNLSLIVANDGGTNYRMYKTYDDDPENAAQLYVKYLNQVGGTITSEPIYFASIDGASSWEKLYWSETGSGGDFRVTIQRWNGNKWVDAMSDLDYNPQGIDISGLGTEAQIRLVGTFTYSSGAPTIHNWTVSCDDVSSQNADLTTSYAIDNTTPCVNTDITYELSVANNGTDEATNINVDVPIPAGLTLADTTISSGTYVSDNWVIPAIQNGETETLTLVLTVDSDQGGNTLGETSAITYLNQTDGDATNNSVTWSITAGANSAPTISEILDQSTAFNTAFSTIDFTVSDAGATVTVASSDDFMFPEGNMTLGGEGTTDRTLDLMPDENQHGTATITITAGDGSCYNEEIFDVEVARHSFATWDTASLVIGQTNFDQNSTTVDQNTTVGANSSDISVLGKLAIGSQSADRVLIYDQIPSTNGGSANAVVGKTSFSSTTSGNSDVLTQNIEGVAFSPDGNKLIASDGGNNRILIWNNIPSSEGTAADVVIGQTNFIDNGSGCSATEFNYPTGLITTPDGKLLIADRNNNRVLIYNQIPTSDGASADVVIGQDDFTTATSGSSSSELNKPWYITLSPTGKLLVSDESNNRVLVFNSVPTTNGASADVVIGQEDFGFVSSSTSNKKFDVPVGVTVSPTGILAVGDFSNRRVLVFNNVPTTNGDSADFVLGQPDFESSTKFNDGTGTEGSPSAMNMWEPYGINFDLNDRLYVNGRGMNRVMVFGDAPSTTCDLEIDAFVDNATPCMGNPVTYTLQVVNNGPDKATNVVMNSALPEGFNYSSHVADRGTYNAQGGTWEIPAIYNGDVLELDITGTVDNSLGGAEIDIYGTVRSMNQAESDFSNNAITKTLTISNNHTPTITSIADQKLAVSSSTGNIAFTVNDDDSDPMTVTATSGNLALVPDENITLTNTAGNDWTINVAPVADTYGSSLITINVTDGTCATTQEFTVYSGNMWVGTTQDWHTESNWTREIAKSGVDAYIPASPSGGSYPVIANDATCNNLMIDEGASLVINNNIELTVEGDLVNDGMINFTNGTTYITATTNITGTGTAQFHNLNISGTLNAGTGYVYIGGNWTNTGTFNQETSTVLFNGTIAQEITTAENFYSFGLTNSAGVTLSAAVNVADTLHLLNGTLSNGANLTLANGIVIARDQGNLAAAPTFSGSANVCYLGTCTMSNEIPGGNSIANLEINGSGAVVTLSADITATSGIDLTEGVINTNGNTLILSNSSAASLTGGSSSSFIYGTLERAIATNTDSYSFPVGNGTASSNYYNAVLMNNNLTGTGTIAASVGGITEAGDNVESNLSVSESDGNSYIGIIEQAAWTISPDVQPSGGTYGLQLYFGALSTLLTDNTFAILKRDENSTSYADWSSYSSTTTIPANGTPGTTVAGGFAQRNGYDSFSQFALGETSNPLPVTLTSFNGTFNNGVIELAWETASEKDNDYFALEKSTDGQNFSEIARIDGSGTAYLPSNYTYIDEDIQGKIHYYRLSQTDFDGTHEKLKIVAVQIPAFNKENTKIFPQPADNELQIQFFSHINTEMKIILYSQQGQLVDVFTQPAHKGYNQHTINVQNIKDGYYYIKLKNKKTEVVKPLIIQHR